MTVREFMKESDVRGGRERERMMRIDRLSFFRNKRVKTITAVNIIAVAPYNVRR